ncbi:MAG: hypothetical protein U0168_07085 [Nannocystaceae bacterium]
MRTLLAAARAQDRGRDRRVVAGGDLRRGRVAQHRGRTCCTHHAHDVGLRGRGQVADDRQHRGHGLGVGEHALAHRLDHRTALARDGMGWQLAPRRQDRLA